MSRDGEGPIWFCLCCGCVGPIVIAKQIIVLVPFTLMCVGGIFCMALFYFIKGLPLLIWAILANRTLGPVVKVLMLLALPVPVALYFPVILIGATFLSLYATIVLPASTTMDTSYHVCGGFGHMFSELTEPLESFWREGRRAIEDINSSRTSDLSPGETPCEIKLSELFWIIVLWTISISFLWVFWVLVTCLKYFPVVCRLILEFWKAYGDKFRYESAPLHCICIPLWFCGMWFIPVFGVLLLAFIVLYGLVVSSYCVVVYWETESLTTAFRYMFACMYEFDRQSTKFIVDIDGYGPTGCSCCDPCIDNVTSCTMNSEDGLFTQEAIEYARSMIKIMT